MSSEVRYLRASAAANQHCDELGCDGEEPDCGGAELDPDEGGEGDRCADTKHVQRDAGRVWASPGKAEVDECHQERERPE